MSIDIAYRHGKRDKVELARLRKEVDACDPYTSIITCSTTMQLVNLFSASIVYYLSIQDVIAYIPL